MSKLKFQIIDQDRVHIELGGGHFTTIDLEDYYAYPPFLFQAWWRSGSNGHRLGCYAETSQKSGTTFHGRTSLRAHRLIMGQAPSAGAWTVDHINGDPLDNRRVNLRWASFTTQGQNKRCLAQGERTLFACLQDSFTEHRIRSIAQELAARRSLAGTWRSGNVFLRAYKLSVKGELTMHFFAKHHHTMTHT